MFARLNLHEFFLFDVDKTLNQLRASFKSELTPATISAFSLKFDHGKLFQKDHYFLLSEKFAVNHGAARFGVGLDLPKAAVYFYVANQKNEERAVQEVRALLQRHNEEWKGRVAGFEKEAIANMEGTIRYHKLEEKLSKITPDNKIVARYFTEMANEKESKVAHNGWIMNHDPMQDFALTGWHYLRRNINIWSDSVKLRYGNCPQDSPYVWEHMSRYVTDMAMVFDGFRLDNAHSTPIHVCYYLLQVARTANPNLFVMAELFTSSAITDALFV